MQNSNVTLTVYSTCAVESLFFGVPVILLDINNLASLQYGDFFKTIRCVKICKDINNFGKNIKELSQYTKEDVKKIGKTFFTENHKKLIKEAINFVKKENVGE